MATKRYLCLMESRRSYNGPRRPSEKTFVYGIHPVTEAIDSGKNLDRIVVSRDGKNERVNKLVGQARARCSYRDGSKSETRLYHA